MVKITSNVYTSFGGHIPGSNAPFSVTLENGAAVVAEEVANHIKRMFPEVQTLPAEDKPKEDPEQASEPKLKEEQTDEPVQVKRTPRKAVK